MPWIALTVDVAENAADAIGDALLEAGAQSVTIDSPDAQSPTLSALFPLGYDVARALAAAATRCGIPTPASRLSMLADEDWVQRSQSQFSPLSIPGKLWIGATWHQPPHEPVALVRIDPGLAFGTGEHPTTRLVLALIATTVKGGERVLDYGCGSGILAIAAAKLGAWSVDAVDIDPQALAVTRRNAESNDVDVSVFAADALPADRTYDLIVANILAQPLVRIAPRLARRAVAGSVIALSGILSSQAPEVADAYAPWFDMTVSDCMAPWALVEGRRK